jgi:hypothetical protein
MLSHRVGSAAPKIGDLRAKEIRDWHHRLASQARHRWSRKGGKQRFGEKPQTDEQKRARRATATIPKSNSRS